MSRSSSEERGRLVAEALRGSWRRRLPARDFPSEARAMVVPLLMTSGAAALAWRRLRPRVGERDLDGQRDPLREIHLLQCLRARVQARDLSRALARLRAVGIEPLVGKGPAAARLYPDPGLRAVGDIDLYVRPSEHAAASAALVGLAVEACEVDLHDGFADLDGAPASALHARARPISVFGVAARAFGPEDHLRLLCLHCTRHGAWRPLWLCDVAAAIESRGPRFDWRVCLGDDARRAERVACAITLAGELLGARLDGAPTARLPRWLLPSVLRRWGAPPPPKTDVRGFLGRPLALVRTLLQRWPDPLTATVTQDAALDERPRLPLQLGECLSRVTRFASALD